MVSAIPAIGVYAYNALSAYAPLDKVNAVSQSAPVVRAPQDDTDTSTSENDTDLTNVGSDRIALSSALLSILQSEITPLPQSSSTSNSYASKYSASSSDNVSSEAISSDISITA